MREDVDGRLLHAGVRHLLAAHLQALVAHASDRRLAG
jgi:hypothetical protein